MSREAWGDSDEDYYLSDKEMEILEEVARERAVEDPELGFGDDGNFDEVEAEWVDSDGDYLFKVTYRGKTVEVSIDADYLAHYWDDDHGAYYD